MQTSPDADNAARNAASLRWSRQVALASLGGLIVLGLAWELWLAPTGSGTLALKVLPLLFAWRGVWRSRLYVYRVLSLLVWPYFTEGVVRAWGDKGLSATLAGFEIVLCLLLFVACLVQVRACTRAAIVQRATA